MRADRQKIFWALVLLLVVGYSLGRPTLERWLGRPLPGFGQAQLPDAKGDPSDPEQSPGSETAGSSTGKRSRSSDSSAEREPAGGSGRASTGRASTGSTGAGKSSPAGRAVESSERGGKAAAENQSEDFFVDLGRNRLQSPAGLIYAMGPGGEHRVDHVLRHAKDDPGRPVHSVFDGTREEILATIDEAWELAQKGGRGVQKSEQDGQTEYTIRMNRRIGYEGGRSGREKNYPDLMRLKLIIQDGNRVITAYPFR